MTTVEFDVFGIPAPQGSTRAFVVGNRAVTTNKGNKTQIAWRDSVAAAAKIAADEHGVCPDGPLRLTVEFRSPMPKSRPKKSRSEGVAAKITSPDLDKLLRSVGDALQAGGLIVDDSRISTISATKREVTGWTGARITIGPEGVWR